VGAWFDSKTDHLKILILILLPISVSCQTKILPYIGIIASGFLDGEAEVLKYNYVRYKAVHPNTNEQYTNPSISWTNKYKNYPIDKREKFIGSTTIFAWTTDKYHLNRTLRNGLLISSLSINIKIHEKQKPITIIKHCIISWGCYALGTQIAHQIYKQ
jgi:hypothetical protein